MSDIDHSSPDRAPSGRRSTFLGSTRSKLIAGGAALALVVGVGGAALAHNAKVEREREEQIAQQAEQDEQTAELVTAAGGLVDATEEAKTTAADAEGHLAADDEMLLADLNTLIAAAGPLQYTSDYGDLDEIVELTGQLTDGADQVAGAVRDFDNSTLGEAIKSAEKRLKDSKGKVTDDKVRGKLSAAIAEAKKVDPEGDLEDIRSATKSVKDAAAKVKKSQDDHAKKQKQEKEKAQQQSAAGSPAGTTQGAGSSPKAPSSNQSHAAPSKPSGSSSSSSSTPSKSKPKPKPAPKPAPAPKPKPKPQPTKPPQPAGLSAGAAKGAIAGLSNGSSGCSTLASYYADTAESLRSWANSFKSSNSPIPVKFTYIGPGSNGTQGISGMLCDA